MDFSDQVRFCGAEPEPEDGMFTLLRELTDEAHIQTFPPPARQEGVCNGLHTGKWHAVLIAGEYHVAECDVCGKQTVFHESVGD